MPRSLTTADRQWLQHRFGHALRFDEPMARHTWMRIGGPAEAFVVPKDLAALSALVRWCHDNGRPCLTIGGGTNLLVADAGVRGVVVSLARCLDRIEELEIENDVVRVTAMAGVKLSALVRYTVENGLRGLTFAAGIPGSVAGAVIMNAGTRQGCMAEVLDHLELLTGDGGTVTASRQQLDIGYRNISWSRVIPGTDAQPVMVIRVSVRLTPGRPDALRKEVAARLEHRQRSQPTNMPSAGCFFKNPSAALPAGRLIDRAGLKGLRVGGAQVSERHANFIVNRGGATAADVLELMDRVRETVFDLCQITLEPEVICVGQQRHTEKPIS